MIFDLLLQMTGLYACIAIGYISAKKLCVEGKGISKLLFYIIVPLVFMHGISKMEIEHQYLLLPLIIFTISCTLALTHFSLAKRVFSDKSANILGFASGNGNIGYFGIPIALMLFEPQIVGIYMVMVIGIMLYETTLGYYITTKGDFSTTEAIKKMIRLPMLHGALVGLALSLLDISLPTFTESFFEAIRGTYTILGMMVVGIALAGITNFKFDWKFTSMAFAVKFIAWPLMVGLFVWIDQQFWQLFTAQVHAVMHLLSFMPLAVNSVIFATLLDAKPEKMATAVFLSTLFALFYVPAMIHLIII